MSEAENHGPTDRPTDQGPMSGEMSLDESLSPGDTLNSTTADMLGPQSHHKRGL